jgi:hypothetical protein
MQSRALWWQGEGCHALPTLPGVSVAGARPQVGRLPALCVASASEMIKTECACKLVLCWLGCEGVVGNLIFYLTSENTGQGVAVSKATLDWTHLSSGSWSADPVVPKFRASLGQDKKEIGRGRNSKGAGSDCSSGGGGCTYLRE